MLASRMAIQRASTGSGGNTTSLPGASVSAGDWGASSVSTTAGAVQSSAGSITTSPESETAPSSPASAQIASSKVLSRSEGSGISNSGSGGKRSVGIAVS